MQTLTQTKKRWIKAYIGPFNKKFAEKMVAEFDKTKVEAQARLRKGKENEYDIFIKLF